MAKLKKRIRRFRRRSRNRIMYGFARFMIFISNIFPRIFWLKLCKGLGSISYYLLSGTRSKVKEHLMLALGAEKSKQELRSLAHQVFGMMGANAGEVFRGFKINDLKSYESFRVIKGVEHIEEAYAKGKGVIILTAHLGAFEFIATELGFRGYKPFIIGSRVKGKKLNELVTRQRSKLGATAIERGKDTLKLIKNLKSGGTVAILIDQDTRVKSVFANFFGIPCATPIGASILSLRTGASVVPMFIHLRDDYMQEINCYPAVQFEITGNEETDIMVNTQKLNDCIETEIRKYPSQWVWMHERWKTKPEEVIE